MKALSLTLAIIFFSFACEKERTKQYKSSNFELKKLADGVYACIHKIGGKAISNAGIIDNGKETFIFDTFLSPDVAKELLLAVKQLNLSPVKYVINSHSHNDHIRGNQVFCNDVKIISTERTKELIEEWEPLDLQEEKLYAPGRYSYYDSLYQSFKGDKNSREYKKILMWRPHYKILSNSHHTITTRLPDLYVDHQLEFDGPDRKLKLISKGEGHTESDLILYLPDDKILFSGDIIFNDCHPYIPHGSISKWKNWLDFLSSMNIQYVVPGHGGIGPKAIIGEMKDYLTTIESIAQKMLENQHSIKDVNTITIPNQYREWWFDRFFEPNLRFAFENIEKDKGE